jgi:hypothetical protein
MAKWKRNILIWAPITAGAVFIAAANWHLVHVAFSSQPDCVAHVRAGDAHGPAGTFSAAQSSCTP